MKKMDPLRTALVELLGEGGAHVNFERAIDGIPVSARGTRVPGMAHTLWEILEHLRIAQWDIVEFTRDSTHVSPGWPEGYWPESEAPPNRTAWSKSVDAFRAELETMRKLVSDPKRDLLAPLPHAPDKTPFREAILLADHNAYHLGEMMALRRLLGVWPKGR